MIVTVTMNAAVDRLYLVERVEPGSVMRVKSRHVTAGGKGLNVSRVAALLGEEVMATGIVGGHAGRHVEELLQADGIRSDFAKAPFETRCCINIRDLASGEHTEFLEPGARVDDAVLEDFYRKYREAVRKSAVVAISGSMPAGTPPDYYARLVACAREHDKKVIVDASGEALRYCLAARPTLIKPNLEEIQQISRVDIHSCKELIDAAKKLHENGIEIVALSMGRNGVLVVCGEGVYRGVPPAIPVVNTVGCGDSMVAGFAAGLSRNLSLLDTLRLSVAVSAANALRVETGNYREKDLDDLLPRVKVLRMDVESASCADLAVTRAVH
jgi:tagatose 6-phosphate kinase